MDVFSVDKDRGIGYPGLRLHIKDRDNGRLSRFYLSLGDTKKMPYGFGINHTTYFNEVEYVLWAGDGKRLIMQKME